MRTLLVDTALAESICLIRSDRLGEFIHARLPTLDRGTCRNFLSGDRLNLKYAAGPEAAHRYHRSCGPVRAHDFSVRGVNCWPVVYVSNIDCHLKSLT